MATGLFVVPVRGSLNSGFLLVAACWLNVGQHVGGAMPLKGQQTVGPLRAALRAGVRGVRASGLVTQALRTSSLAQPVFIEDTDAYGVVYHNNYVKFVHRGLQAHYAREDGALSLSARPVELLALDEMRFVRPATLGDEVRVVTSVTGVLAGGVLVADHALVCAVDGEEFFRARSYSRARQAARSPVAQLEGLPEWAQPLDAPIAARALAYGMDVWEDELSLCGGLSSVAVLRAFERARTESLGGPAMLSRLQDERIKCLVARIDQLALNTDLARGLPSVQLGQLGLRVLLTADVRKARIIFEQQLVCGTASSEPEDSEVVLARGLVTCLCVDADSGKMSAPPAWLTSRYERR